MQPNIGYVRSADGTRIAFWTLGAGPPLLLLPNLPVASIEHEWRTESCRQWYESLAEERCLIGYDGRGSGLSERAAEDFSLEAQVADALAVIERVGQKQLPVIGILHSCSIAVRLAVEEERAIERMILWAPYARGEDYGRSPVIRATRTLLAEDWHGFARTVGFYAFGWTMPEEARAMERWYDEATDQQTVLRQLEARDRIDISADLERVDVPTLVLYRRNAAWPRVETSATVAASIPAARMAIVDGSTTNPWGESTEEMRSQIDGFLAEPLPVRPRVRSQPARVSPESAEVEQSRLYGLTFRELEVLQHVAAGSSNQEIAAALFLSVRTVEKHIANIYGKLELRGRADAAAFAVRKGLVPSA